MPTKYYSSAHTKAQIAEAEEKGLLEVACQVVIAQRKPLPEDEWISLDVMSEDGDPVIARNPLQLYFEDGRIRFGITIADEPQINAILADYGVGTYGELVGKSAVAYKQNAAEPDEEPLPWSTIAFSRHE